MGKTVGKATVRAKISARMLVTRGTTHADQGVGPRIFVALAADYGNLGDLAITHAQLALVRQVFPGREVVEMPISKTLETVQELKRNIRPRDIVTLIGGGNTGDLYDDIQHLREMVISAFPANRIVSFPQTIEFSQTIYGRLAARRASWVYGRHPDLWVIARDSRSEAIARRMFPRARVLLAPDVVLTLDKGVPPAERDGVLVALRTDLERGLSDKAHASIVRVASAFGRVVFRDTHIGEGRMMRPAADRELEDAWESWRSARVVITDRLHGMIFAVITGTPCLVLDSSTGKVGQFYRDWLSDLPNVRLTSQADFVDVARHLTELVETPSSYGGRRRLAAQVADAARAALLG